MHLSLEEGLLDYFGDDDPGDDAHGTAKEVIMIFLCNCQLRITNWQLVAGWSGAEDFADADDKGVELIGGVHKAFHCCSF